MAYRLLVGIPMITGADHCRKAIESVIYNPLVDVLIIDNGAERSVKDMIKEYEVHSDFHVIRNESNVYVNRAWNQIIEFFLAGSYSRLCIMNSDLIMSENWHRVVQKRWEVNPDEVLLPVMNEEGPYGSEVMEAKVVTEGTPGVFITLNTKQAALVYPIPEEIRVWYGDNFIFGRLRKYGYQTVIPPNLLATHAWSSTVSVVPGIHQIIEEDKVAWEKIKHLI